MRVQPGELAVLIGLLSALFLLSGLAAAKRQLERRKKVVDSK